MPITLRAALAETMKGWKSDLRPGWKEVLGNIDPDLDAVDPELTLEPWEPIFPARRRRPDADPESEAQRVMRLMGTDRDAHIFRALDDIDPPDVKAVILGQDPYPHITRATGRAFEAGDLTDWHRSPWLVASSLRHIVQALAFAQSCDPRYAEGDKAWDLTARDIADSVLDIPRPKALFDRWQKRGVLMLNTGLTITRYKRGGHAHQLRGHIPYWRPVIDRIVGYLIRRQAGAVVFLNWGGPAKRFFRDNKIRETSQKLGSWHRTVTAVEKSHPAYRKGNRVPFLEGGNPFLEANRQLAAMGANPIRW